MLYLSLKAAHIIAFVAWMAAIFYLPRLYVYHVETGLTGPQAETFKVMERRLLKVIMTPAMVATWVFGIAMISVNPSIMAGAGWLHAKLVLLLLMSGFHGYLSALLKKFEAGTVTQDGKFFRLINEVPTVLLIAIVILAVLRPF